MFWGTILKHGNAFKIEEKEGQNLLHISNVALSGTSEGKTSLFAKVEGKKHLLTSLEHGKHEHVFLDLYFRAEQKVEFTVEGKGEVHLSGYFEPDSDDADGLDEDISDEEYEKLGP